MTKCTTCGKFMKLEEGCSWVFVPDSEFTYEEMGVQCKKCTKKFGLINSRQAVNQLYCSGMFKVKKNMEILCDQCGDDKCICGQCRGVGEESKQCEEHDIICEWNDDDTTCINLIFKK